MKRPQRLRRLWLAALAAAAALAACGGPGSSNVPPGSGAAADYAVCGGAVTCGDGFACEPATLRTSERQPAARFCTRECGASCPGPRSDAGFATGTATCVIANDRPRCYRVCNFPGDCPEGSLCSVVAGTMQSVCVPLNVPLRRAYERCDPDNEACPAGTQCIDANVTTSGQPPTASLCSANCVTTGCPQEAGQQRPGLCVTANMRSRCYARCGADGACPTGTTCAQPMGAPERICVPNS